MPHIAWSCISAQRGTVKAKAVVKKGHAFQASSRQSSKNTSTGSIQSHATHTVSGLLNDQSLDKQGFTITNEQKVTIKELPGVEEDGQSLQPLEDDQARKSFEQVLVQETPEVHTPSNHDTQPVQENPSPLPLPSQEDPGVKSEDKRLKKVHRARVRVRMFNMYEWFF